MSVALFSAVVYCTQKSFMGRGFIQWRMVAYLVCVVCNTAPCHVIAQSRMLGAALLKNATITHQQS